MGENNFYDEMWTERNARQDAEAKLTNLTEQVTKLTRQRDMLLELLAEAKSR
jgi:Fe2+ or Zn2+ uptake regulation protein